MAESKCIPGLNHEPPAPSPQPPTPSPLPAPQGLYDPRNEHDACGIGFVASISGHKSHDIIAKGIQVLINLTHRGACGCDPETGDGAGILKPAVGPATLTQTPQNFSPRGGAALGSPLPPKGKYGALAGEKLVWD